MPKIELLLIDTGHPSLGMVSASLPTEHYRIAAFPDAESLLIHVMRNSPNPEPLHRCALLKQRLENMSAVEAQRHLRQLDPDLLAVIYSEAPTVSNIIEAWRSGADDYLLYPFDGDDLNASLDRIISKRTPRQPVAKQAAGNGRMDKGALQSLTTRERDIMQLIVDGKKNNCICEVLSISLATVKMHRANLMRKLGVHNAAQLTTYFHKHADASEVFCHPRSHAQAQT